VNRAVTNSFIVRCPILLIYVVVAIPIQFAGIGRSNLTKIAVQATNKPEQLPDCTALFAALITPP